MTQLVLEIKDNKDLDVLLLILQKFGVTIKQRQTISTVSDNKEHSIESVEFSKNSSDQVVSTSFKKNKNLSRLYSFMEEKAITVNKIEIPNRDERNQR